MMNGRASSAWRGLNLAELDPNHLAIRLAHHGIASKNAVGNPGYMPHYATALRIPY